jgi:hypothetical protein
MRMGYALGGMFFLDRSSSVHGSCVGESLFTLCNGRQAPLMAVVDWCYCSHTVNGRRRIFPHAVFFERSAYAVEQGIFGPLLFVFLGLVVRGRGRCSSADLVECILLCLVMYVLFLSPVSANSRWGA